jgi:hypothetical protein
MLPARTGRDRLADVARRARNTTKAVRGGKTTNDDEASQMLGMTRQEWWKNNNPGQAPGAGAA